MFANIGLVRSAETPYLTPNSSSDLPRRAFFLALAFGPLWPGGCGRYTVAIFLSYEVRRLTFVFSHLYVGLGRVSPRLGLSYGAPMTFRLVHAQYERNSRRAYVELRKDDADGGEVIVTAIFTYRRTSITKRALEQELATKARHLMKRASVGLDER